MKRASMEKEMIKKGNTYYPPKCPHCKVFGNVRPALAWNPTLKVWQCSWCGYELGR